MNKLCFCGLAAIDGKFCSAYCAKLHALIVNWLDLHPESSHLTLGQVAGNVAKPVYIDPFLAMMYRDRKR